MIKPRTKQVLVTYLDHDNSWYPAKVESLLSVQFTVDFKLGKDIKHGYYFYKDRNITWKDKEKQSVILEPDAVAVYDTLMGAELIQDWKRLRLGLDWFIDNEPKAYMVLLD